jgi:hypothetical protein
VLTPLQHCTRALADGCDGTLVRQVQWVGVATTDSGSRGVTLRRLRSLRRNRSETAVSDVVRGWSAKRQPFTMEDEYVLPTDDASTRTPTR